MSKTNPIVELTDELLMTTKSARTLGLNLLLAEIQALSVVLPGALAHLPMRSELFAATDEADFDNMPV
ncbi:MAG: hypothetical protein JWS10_343 [Cypionkella sp.]|uniref:hypothetical protein n=1 Tax=Cypionkella sp. TaxID=2811411 RepID=UPI0026196840|nr:hypothetical protein [Cypionkella sp.]MDB5657728.1 hypothetical protein [Cypionkella sp.]